MQPTKITLEGSPHEEFLVMQLPWLYGLGAEVLRMPTAKKCISVTGSDDAYEALEFLSAKREQSITEVIRCLTQRALEFQECVYFARVSDARLIQARTRVSAFMAWE